MQWKKYINEILLVLIITVGFILRFYHFFNLPFTWDELSAWNRLHFNSFSELIELGIKPDGHPAGVQVFLYYWVLLFGDSEWVIKLPFNIMGIASIYIFYKIGKTWWNKSVGLLASAFMASLQFFVLYSPIARPYISGLFLTLMMVYFWSYYMYRVPRRKYLIGFIIFAALSAYNHHFSLLFAAIVGFTGLFTINKHQIKEYILAGIIIFVLYIPHLPVFFHQLGVGGIGGTDNWLTKPPPDFVLQFTYWAFHYSKWVYGVVILLIIMSLFFRNKENELAAEWKKRLILLSWFGLPILIGYYYSAYINPVIQFSMLLFSFPYLLLLLFSGFRKLKPFLIIPLVLLILILNTTTLISARKHYQIIFKQPFEGTAQTLVSNTKINSNDIYLLHNYIPNYQQYYLRKHQLNEIQSLSIYDKGFNIHQLDSLLLTIEQDYILVSGLPENLVQAVAFHYPYLIKRTNGYTYESYLFSRTQKTELSFHKIIEKSEFDRVQTSWNIDNKRLVKDSTGQIYFQFLNKQEWGFNFSDSLYLMNNDYGFIIDMEAEIVCHSCSINPTWVATFSTPNEDIIWRGANVKQQSIKTTNGYRIFFSIDTRLLIDKDQFNNTHFKTYFWNNNHDHFTIKELNIYIRKPNPIKYGLFELLEK